MQRTAAFLVIWLGLVAATSSQKLRGLNPELASHYTGDGGVFTCLDGSLSVPFARVNDDYCDCPDGTDEPGTAACHNGRFYCRNLGHEPKLLSSSFVNDGVCDCCDGADELEGCTNTCLEKSAAHRENLQKQVDSYAAALTSKATYIAQAQTKRAEMNQRSQVIDSEIESQQKLIVTLQAEKDAAEAEAAAEEEAKRLAAEEAARQLEELQQQQQQEAASATVDTPTEAHTEPEQAEERSLHEEQPSEGAPEQEETAEETGRRIASQWTHDPEAAGLPEEGEDLNEGIEHNAEYDEEEDPGYHAADHEYEDVSTSVGAARSRLREAEAVLQTLEKEKADIAKYLHSGLNFGPDDVFLALAGRCITGVQTRWTYEACIFSEAFQKEGYNNKVNIGRWKGFEENYTELVFTDGDYCHGVGNRSFRITLSCGPTEVLSDAEEPGTCKYTAKMTSPAVCSELEYQHLKDSMRQLEEYENQIRLQIAGQGAKDEL